MGLGWHHQMGDGAQPFDHISRLVEPAHMRVAGCEPAVGWRIVRVVLDREQEPWYRLIEVPAQEMVGTNYLVSCAGGGGARAETQRGLYMVHRDVKLARPMSKNAADVPPTGEAGVERQRAIDQHHHGADVLAEIRQRHGSIRKNTRIVASHLQGAAGEIGAFAAVRLWILAPAVHAEAHAADRGPTESRSVMRVTPDGLLKQTECLGNLRG